MCYQWGFFLPSLLISRLFIQDSLSNSNELLSMRVLSSLWNTYKGVYGINSDYQFSAKASRGIDLSILTKLNAFKPLGHWSIYINMRLSKLKGWGRPTSRKIFKKYLYSYVYVIVQFSCFLKLSWIIVRMISDIYCG